MPSAETSPKRRTRVKGKPGIYFRLATDGRTRLYEVTFLDHERRRRWKRVEGNLEDAQRELRRAKGLVDGGTEIPKSNRVTLSELGDEWLETVKATKRPRTYDSYSMHLARHVKPRLGMLRAKDVSPNHVRRLIAELNASGYSPWTIHGALTTLSALMRYAKRVGLIGLNPVRDLERGERPPQPRRPLTIRTTEELKALLDAALPDTTIHAMIATAALASLRQSEVLGLLWGDVHLDEGVIHIRRQYGRDGVYAPPKTDAGERAVDIPNELVKLLTGYKLAQTAWHKADNAPVFCSSIGRPIDHRNATRRFNAAVGRSKLSERVAGFLR